ncbi:hypothetical protein T484DRAFT_1902353 [Baffinella frigidus]|nr:hypothetical protein T484DRAFT_1902353 [Cryptophyta sp. CCMP2293]
MVRLRRVLLTLFVVCALSPARSGAFMTPSFGVAFTGGRGLRAPPVAQQSLVPQLRVAGRNVLGNLEMVSPADAVSALQGWSGTPSGARVVCSTATSDAGVMAALFKELAAGAGDKAVLVAPSYERAAADKLPQLVAHMATTCSWADVALLEGAPHPSLTFTSKAGGNAAALPQTSQEEVMGLVLDWFAELMIECEEEDTFVDIGRVLLGVKRYCVTAAEGEEALQELFWKEVQTIVEGGDGNTMLVAEKFLIADPVKYQAFVEEKLSAPLLAWAGHGKELRVSWYHPLTAKAPSPWPIIQIHVFDPAPPAKEGEGFDDLDFNADSGMEFQKITVDEIRRQAGLDAKPKGLSGIQKLDLKEPPSPKKTPLGGILNMDELELEEGAKPKGLSGIQKLDLKEPPSPKKTPLGGILNMDELE